MDFSSLEQAATLPEKGKPYLQGGDMLCTFSSSANMSDELALRGSCGYV